MRNDESKINSSLIEIATALTAEKDYNQLLDQIVSNAMDITNADGGTLYILHDGYLHHKIMHTISTGFSKGNKGESIDIEPIILGKDHISSYAALEKSTVKIDDVYHSDLFDFSGPKQFDAFTGYKTTSMLVCPMINRKKQVVGVLQLINALDNDGQTIPFKDKYVSAVESLASLAGISIENMTYIEEIRNLFESFVKVIAKTIDERTPYNKLHSENLSKRILDFAQYLNSVDDGKYEGLHFDNEQLHKLVTAAWLHDIGKIVVPLEMLDKPDRLDFRYKHLMDRYDLIQMTMERNYFRSLHENGYDAKVEEVYRADLKQLDAFRDFVSECNQSHIFIDEARQEAIDQLRDYRFPNIKEAVLTDEEYEHLSITKGTLTPKERKMVQEHMPAGERILSELNFPDYLEGIFDWIIKHHEYLDGSGYPHQCTSKDITIESRMMTMLDIFDSLVQSDRPYKKAMPTSKALSIIKAMAQEGKLDGDLVAAFEDSDIWKVKL